MADLQVMLGHPDPGVPGLIAEARVGSDLCQHPLEQARILPGHAALELVTPSDDAVQERVKVYRRPPAGVRGAGVDREAPASYWRLSAPLEHDAGG